VSGQRLASAAARAVVVLGAAAVLSTTTARADEDLPAGLVKAYKKEYAFLEAEKKALEKRLAQFEKQSDEQLGKAEDEVNALQSQLLRIREKADELEMSLAEAERIVMATDEDVDVLEETVSRAVETLQNEGFTVALPEAGAADEQTAGDTDETAAGEQGVEDQTGDGDAEEDDPLAARQPRLLEGDEKEQKRFVVELFEKAVEAMARGSQLRRETGSFFLEDGTRTEGELIHVGRVATYGVGDEAAGVLAPAGSGRLKMWPGDAARIARALQAGETPPVLKIFLYESLDKGVEEEKEKTVLSVIQSGKVIGWVIVVMGLLGLLLILVRTVILFTVGSSPGRLESKLTPLVEQGRLDEALAVCSRSRTAAARVLAATVRNLKQSREKLEDVVSEAILREAPLLERFGSTILVFAAVAPLLGLLGTVTGIISTFDVITEFGTGDPKLLSGGISEALVTTELGLIVAIPTLLLGTLLSGRARGVLGQISKSALALVNTAKQEAEGSQEDLGPTDTRKEPEPEVVEEEVPDNGGQDRTQPLVPPAPEAK
jgi:biopolymer transport protein ExbB